MKLRQIEYALQVARTLSFRLAAEQLGVTQPTLSNGLSAFEQELGGRLFERTTRDVSLTAFGGHMLPFLQAVIEDRDMLLQAARAYRDPSLKLLRIGLSPLADLKTIERSLAPFRQMFPEVKIYFKECLVDDLNERLLNDKLDIGLRVKETLPEGLTRQPAYREPVYYLPQEGLQPANSPRPLQISELPEVPIICTSGACGLNKALEAIFAEAGRDLHIYPGQALSYQAIEEWTELGIGAGILPYAKLSSGNVTASPLIGAEGAPVEFSYEWVFRKAVASTTPPHILKFREQIKSMAKV